MKINIDLTNPNSYVIIGILVLVLLFGVLLGQLIQRILDLKTIKKEREDAVRKSRAVLGGQFSEQLAPYLPNFPCNPGDVRFVGKPIDYVAFPGAAEGKEIKEILLIEVKTGSSQLSDREKEIRRAVDAGRVRYVEYRISD